MTKDEALKMCLEYIETDAHERKYVRHAIKEALAQPEHGWTSERIAGMSRLKEAQDKRQEFPKRFDTHPTPPQRKPLTDEEIHQLDPFPHTMFDQQRIDFTRAIEAAHGIKGEA